MNINLKDGEKFVSYKASLANGYIVYLSQYESGHASIEMYRKTDNDDMNKGVKLFTQTYDKSTVCNLIYFKQELQKMIDNLTNSYIIKKQQKF